jgi:hypothetical protein
LIDNVRWKSQAFRERNLLCQDDQGRSKRERCYLLPVGGLSYPGGKFVPRLSVIVPHRRDEQLEASLLSLLENRPEDCEIIVVHDGSYSDPYELGDEVLFVDIDPTDSTPDARVVQLLNAGLMAACSPVISTLLDGVTVSLGWEQRGLTMLEQTPDVGGVSIGIQRPGEGPSFGITQAMLGNPRRALRAQMTQSRRRDTCAAPELACSLLRRSTLLALEGFRGLTVPAAEFDLGIAMQQLGYDCLCDCETIVADANLRQLSSSSLTEISRLAVHHGLIAGGFLSALSEMPAALLAGPTAAGAWCKGISRSMHIDSDPRLERARKIQAERALGDSYKISSADSEAFVRKAA